MSRLTDRLLAAALAAAERGWHVFPIQPNRKKPPALHGDTKERPCPRTGICRDGHKGWEQRATTDPDRIRRAWSTGAYNVGIATGPSGLVVVDLDLPKSPADLPPARWRIEGIRDGHDVFTAVCQEHAEEVPWDTYSARSARGGTHLYFAAPQGVRLSITEGDKNGLGWKVDTRAHGGYVVAAGSITSDGPYTVADERDPAVLPSWLTTLLVPRPKPAPVVAKVNTQRLPAYVRAAVDGECDRVAAAQGGRHTGVLFASSVALGQLVGARLVPWATAKDALRNAARHMIVSDCDCTESEVDRTIDNGLRAGSSRPRQVKGNQLAPAPRTIWSDWDVA
ncbi:bifunctional DNA primase/polymerase [Kibdelosporangium lantanae]